KTKLCHFDGRGKMESVYWFLAAAGVEVCFSVPTFKLCIGGSLVFQQMPMVEISGMKMVQTGTILSYIAAKYNLCGKDLKERALIDMYVGGTGGIFFSSPHHFCNVFKQKITRQKAALVLFKVTRLGSGNYNSSMAKNISTQISKIVFSCVTFSSLNTIYLHFTFLAFKASISTITTIKKFLEPGSQRKPVPDDKYVGTVR
ncbi:GSTA3 transferase, partial [Oreotrochilus melanogaster]|nr:GSTA3 transferase [Oreotrochilus melanogaster]